MESFSVQEKYAPHSECFGCGPSNSQGLKIRTIPTSDLEAMAVWTPQPHHGAFPGVLSGGIVGTLLDCHSNWTAAWHLMRKSGEGHPPCTVTAEYSVKLLAPTPTDLKLEIYSKVIDSGHGRASVEAKIIANGKVTATCHGTFVAVKPGHPAYHRW